MDLSVIIVNWNSKEHLQKCVASILNGSCDRTFEVIVIDSGSHDGAGEMLRRCYPDVRFIQSDKNLGFARANNVAFQASIGDRILFLNPDTEIVGSAISVMCDHMRLAPAMGAIGCRLINADGSVQTSCIQAFPTILNQCLNAEILRKLLPRSRLWGMAPLFVDDCRPAEVEVISGACLLVARAQFEKVGGFDERYFMYAEDVDLCYKLKQSGAVNYYVPCATVKHFGGASAQYQWNNFSAVMMRASILQFLRTTRGDLHGMGYRVSMLISAVGRIVCLCAALPLYVVRGGWRSWMCCLRKWLAISAWSIAGTGGVRSGS